MSEEVLRKAGDVFPAVTLDENHGEYQLWVGPAVVGYGGTPEQAKANAADFLSDIAALLMVGRAPVSANSAATGPISPAQKSSPSTCNSLSPGLAPEIEQQDADWMIRCLERLHAQYHCEANDHRRGSFKQSEALKCAMSLEYALAAVRHAPLAPPWQPISSAPEGTLLLYRPLMPKGHRYSIRAVSDWCGPACCPSAEPQFWMPLPLAPHEDANTILRENWHAIEGPNGLCACGTERGRCGERLRAAFQHRPLSIPSKRRVVTEPSLAGDDSFINALAPPEDRTLFPPAPEDDTPSVPIWYCVCGARNYRDGRADCWKCHALAPHEDAP